MIVPQSPPLQVLISAQTVSHGDVASQRLPPIAAVQTNHILEITRGDREPERLPYLKIDQEIVRQMSGIASVPSGKTGYSGFELDDLLLGHFESLGWYVKKKLIDYDAAYSSFSYYLTETYEHPEIKK